MTEKTWTLREIQDAYAEILKAFNVVYPVGSVPKRKDETLPEAFDPEGERFFQDTFIEMAKKAIPKLKAAADRSGNARIWHRGESLDGIDQRMRERIEKALEFGF